MWTSSTWPPSTDKRCQNNVCVCVGGGPQSLMFGLSSSLLCCSPGSLPWPVHYPRGNEDPGCLTSQAHSSAAPPTAMLFAAAKRRACRFCYAPLAQQVLTSATMSGPGNRCAKVSASPQISQARHYLIKLAVSVFRTGEPDSNLCIEK